MKRALALLPLVSMLSVAHATDFSAPITDAEGKPAVACNEKTPECEKPLTLGRVVAVALFTNYPDEADPRSAPSGDEKVKRARIAMDVINGGNVDLKAEDIALAKKLVAKAYGPLVVMRAWELLDPPKR